MDGKMRKLLLINICVLLTVGCATAPVQVQDKVDYHALPGKFKEIYYRTVCRDVSIHVNFYEWQGEYLDHVHTIALLPAGYAMTTKWIVQISLIKNGLIVLLKV